MTDEKWNDEYLGLLDNIVINAGDTIDDIINNLKDAYEQLPKDMSKLSSWATTYTK
jgi:arsenate reductase-like glutaredoxin family protein